jgi:hypothetical protein
MPLNPADLDSRVRSAAAAAVAYWDGTESSPPSVVRDAVTAIVEAPSSDTLAVVIERFVGTAEPSLEPDCAWADAPVGIILRGLYLVARELLRTPEGQRPLVLCNAIRDAVSMSAQFDGEPNELVAALMTVEDAVSAIEGYLAFPPFAFVDEAYLAKYGLLQALQVGFDAAECVARVLGEKLRADKMPGGKVVLVTRNIVAGHPIGGNMAGEAWLHFHDRATAHDKDVIRVMSFSRRDPEKWTGQSITTADLVRDGLAVISELLSRALDSFTRRAES